MSWRWYAVHHGALWRVYRGSIKACAIVPHGVNRGPVIARVAAPHVASTVALLRRASWRHFGSSWGQARVKFYHSPFPPFFYHAFAFPRAWYGLCQSWFAKRQVSAPGVRVQCVSLGLPSGTGPPDGPSKLQQAFQRYCNDDARRRCRTEAPAHAAPTADGKC